MTSQKQQNSNLKPCTASQDLCPNLFLADFCSWFWTLFKLSENRKKDLNAPQIKWSDYKWSYLTIKANAKSLECFWTTQHYFESSNEKFQKSSFLHFEYGSEYGSGFARLLKSIKNGAFDIFYSNTIELHWLMKFCGHCTWLADFRGLWNLKKSKNWRFLYLFAQKPANCGQNSNVIKKIFIGPPTR